MKFVDVKDLTVLELTKKKAALNGEIFEARMKNELGQLSNPVQIRFMRKNLARLNTALAHKSVR